MKMVKSLLLGSAAGLVAVAGAQAADLPVKSKAVLYVKICSLYGDGYYYVPGTDTCLKLSGYIRADYGWNTRGARTINYSGVGGLQDRSVADYSTRHRANTQIDTRTQTAYGTVRTLTSIHVVNQDQAEEARVARGLIQFAGFTFGRTKSYSDTFGLGDNYAYQQIQNQSDTGTNGVNQISYTAEFGNGVTLTLGAEERRNKALYNFGAAATKIVGVELGDSHIGERFPDPFLAFKIEQAWGFWAATLVVHDDGAQYYGTTTTTGHPSDKLGFGIMTGGELKLPWIGQRDRIGYYGHYGVGTSAFTGGSNLASPAMFGNSGASAAGPAGQVAYGPISDGVYANNGGSVELTTTWTLAGGFEHYWSPALRTTLYGTYTQVSYNATAKGYFQSAIGCAAAQAGVTAFGANFTAAAGSNSCDPNWRYWGVGSRTNWQPVQGMNLGVDIFYTRISTAFAGTATITPGAGTTRAAGTYTVADQGLWGFMFRAQRNFGPGAD